MKRHILLISQYFYPENFRVNDMALEWVERGYEVTVLTGYPNYPEGEFYDGYTPAGVREEEWRGARIIRLPIRPRGHGSVQLVKNYLSFVRCGRQWIRHTKIQADIVFTFEVSPMTQALLGVWYGIRFHVPSLLYVQDLWPENIEAVMNIHNPIIIGMVQKMVDYIYAGTTQIFTTSPSFVDAIVNRKKPVPRNKVCFWPQYAEDFYVPVPNDDRSSEAFRIVFTGNIGTAQGLNILPKAAAQLAEEKVEFVIVGDGRGKQDLEREIEQLGVSDMFRFVPRQPAREIPKILSTCHCAFLSFQPHPLWSKTIPAKLQSYMACGMPIIASAEGETKRVMEEASCGVCCRIGDVNALCEGIRSMMKQDLSAYRRNARAYCLANYSKKNLMDQMDSYLRMDYE